MKKERTHLHRDIGEREGEAAVAEGLGQGDGQHQPREHQREEQEPHGRALGVEPVRHPEV
jgi:hypothetical protein